MTKTKTKTKTGKISYMPPPSVTWSYKDKGGHHYGSDTPTSARAVLHHIDPKVPNIMDPSVPVVWSSDLLSKGFFGTLHLCDQSLH